MKNLPENLYHLRLKIRWDDKLVNSKLKLLDCLPKNLKKLQVIFTNNFNYSKNISEFNNLPLELEYLHIVNPHKKTSFNNLPIGLKFLTIECGDLKYPLDNLPPNLEELTIGSIFSVKYKPIISNYPLNLKKIKFIDTYPLENLPDSLEELVVEKLQSKKKLKFNIDLLKQKIKKVTLINI